MWLDDDNLDEHINDLIEEYLEYNTAVDKIDALVETQNKNSLSLGAVKRKIDSCDKKIKSSKDAVVQLQSQIETLKQDIIAELTKGAWQQMLQEAVKKATKDLEEKIKTANQAATKQISELIKHENYVRDLTKEIKAIKK